jgi:hypothetical protein
MASGNQLAALSRRPPGGASRGTLSTSPSVVGSAPWLTSPSPVPRAHGYSVSPRTHIPESASSGPTTSSRSSIRSIYSPQLPALPSDLQGQRPQRRRLSLRPPSSRGASTTPVQRHSDEDEDDDPENDCHADDDADALSEDIMAIDMKNNGNLGCAYYIAADEALFLLEDVAMAGVEIVETLLLHVKPTTILTPGRTSQVLMDVLERDAQGIDRDDQHSKSFILLSRGTL